jgi:hypothetical protein
MPIDARKFDLAPKCRGFWHSDSQTVGKVFMSEDATIEEAREMAHAFGGPTTIYTWHHGEPIELCRTRGSLLAATMATR